MRVLSHTSHSKSVSLPGSVTRGITVTRVIGLPHSLHTLSSSSRSEDRIGDTPAPVERVEHGDAVGARDHRLAVQRERLGPQLGGGRGDGGIAVGPVMAAACEQPHGLAVPAHDQPIAVVLDLVHPVGPEGGLADGMQARQSRRFGCAGLVRCSDAVCVSPSSAAAIRKSESIGRRIEASRTGFA
jgi:hypothetical protein